MSYSTSSHNLALNSITYEGKTLLDWIEYFKLNLSSKSEETLLLFLNKSSEAYYLYSKIKTYLELFESKMKNNFEGKKIEIVNSFIADSKKVPSQEYLDTLVKDQLSELYKEYGVIKTIYVFFEVVIKEYESFSYIINKNF